MFKHNWCQGIINPRICPFLIAEINEAYLTSISSTCKRFVRTNLVSEGKFFLKDELIQKLSAFNVTAPSKRVFFEKITIAITVVTATVTGIQAILPESTKNQIIS